MSQQLRGFNIWIKLLVDSCSTGSSSRGTGLGILPPAGEVRSWPLAPLIDLHLQVPRQLCINKQLSWAGLSWAGLSAGQWCLQALQLWVQVQVKAGCSSHVLQAGVLLQHKAKNVIALMSVSSIVY